MWRRISADGPSLRRVPPFMISGKGHSRGGAVALLSAKEHDVGLGSVNGVMDPAPGLLHAQGSPLVLLQ